MKLLLFLIIIVIIAWPTAKLYLQEQKGSLMASLLGNDSGQTGLAQTTERLIWVDNFFKIVNVDDRDKKLLNIGDFALDEEHAGALFLGTKDGNLFQKLPEQSQLVRLPGSGFLQNEKFSIIKIVSDPFKTGKLYLLASNQKKNSILYSEDRGVNFKELYTVGRDQNLAGLVSDPSREGVLWAATDVGLILKSSDYGGTWRTFSVVPGHIARVFIQGGSAPQLVIATLDGLVFLSTTISPSLKKVVLPFSSDGAMNGIAPDPWRAGRFLAWDNANLFLTNNGGASFTKLALPVMLAQNPVSDVSFSETNPKLIYVAAGNLLLISKDGGLSWKVGRFEVKTIKEMKIDPQDENKIYLKVAD